MSFVYSVPKLYFNSGLSRAVAQLKTASLTIPLCSFPDTIFRIKQESQFDMETQGIDQGLPSTPWATRFPHRSLTYVSSGQNRSVLAPEYPRMDDPVHYDEALPDPTDNPPIVPLDHRDEDRLFWSEKKQRRQLKGIQTWQAAALNRRLRFTSESGYLSSGHSRIDWFMDEPSDDPESSMGVPKADQERDFMIYERERIRVDETQWLPFLRKDRWFDWIEAPNVLDSPEAPDPRDSPGQPWSPDGHIWSIENPIIWDAVKVSFELANRALEAMIEDKHEGGMSMTLSLLVSCQILRLNSSQ